MEVEFLAGTSIEDAITEAKQKAIDWGICYVKFSFNGIEIDVSYKADVELLVDKYSKAFENNTKFIVG